MKNKAQRLIAIRKIISEHKISTQEELLSKLEEEGFSYTQATLSRDLRTLRVGKKSDVFKGYVYFIQEPTRNGDFRPSFANETNSNNGFVSLKFSHSLAVMRTLPGYAASIASRIDSKGPFEIIGTIAGDDTILIIPVEGISRHDVINAIVGVFPELKGVI